MLKLVLKRLMSHLPSSLPTGLTEHEKWAADIIELAGPIADTQSMRFVLAGEIMHSPAGKSSIPKAYFVRRLHKLAANQVAGVVFQKIKEEQLEASKPKVEDTTTTAVSSNGDQQQ